MIWLRRWVEQWLDTRNDTWTHASYGTDKPQT